MPVDRPFFGPCLTFAGLRLTLTDIETIRTFVLAKQRASQDAVSQALQALIGQLSVIH
jgi:hypothetical protein